MPPTPASPAPERSSLETPPEESGQSEAPFYPFDSPDRRNALKQLSAALTHRLGTLTSTISGYADLLVDTTSTQERREIALDVMEATTQIEDLIADLRYYSRPLEPTIRTVSLQDVLQSAVTLLDEQSKDRVRQRVEPNAVREIDVDPRLLRQALFNLLQNALEATASPPANDVLIRATLAEGKKMSDQTVSFEVWNDGEIGLENPEEVFRPFFSTRPNCLGLGLPIASHIAEQHGGTVQLTTNSAADGGTCFTLRV